MLDTAKGMGRRQVLVRLLGTACIAMLPVKLIGVGTPSTAAKSSSALETSAMPRGLQSARTWRNVYFGTENNWGQLPLSLEDIRSSALSASSERNVTGDAMARDQ